MPTIKIHNTETNEIIEREMTLSEITILEEEQTSLKIERDKEKAKLINKSNLLQKLGITEEEAAVLLS